MKEILLQRNTSYADDEGTLFHHDCASKIRTDIAAVIVSIDSPKFDRMIKTAKVTLSDKLATLGKTRNINISFHLSTHNTFYNSSYFLYINLYAISGGNAGLFTGMSILSLFEIGFWIIRFLSRMAYGSNNANMSNKTEATSDERSLAKKHRHTLNKRGHLSKIVKRRMAISQQQTE